MIAERICLLELELEMNSKRTGAGDGEGEQLTPDESFTQEIQLGVRGMS